MYSDALDYANNCSQCAIVQGTGRRHKPPLHSIVTESLYQIVGVDIMELPRSNHYVIVFQDFFAKWISLYQTKTSMYIAQLLFERCTYL